MSEDPAYDPGQTWWDRMWGTIGSWWRSIPAWEKALAGTILVIASIGIAVATGGASIGPEAQLLGGVSALAAAAKVALIEVSIGIGFAVAGWAISSAISGNWDTNALNDAVADAIFFTGLFMFLSTSINAIKYSSRAYNTPVADSGTLNGYELDPRSVELAKEGNPSYRTFRKRVWQNEYRFNKGAYNSSQWSRMSKGKAPLVNGNSMHLHHIVGKSVDPYYVIKVTASQHTAIHKAIGYYVTRSKLPWTLANAIKYGGLM